MIIKVLAIEATSDFLRWRDTTWWIVSVCVPAPLWAGWVCAVVGFVRVNEGMNCWHVLYRWHFIIDPKGCHEMYLFSYDDILQRVEPMKWKQNKVPSLFLFAVCWEQTFTSPWRNKLTPNRKISNFFGQTFNPLLCHLNGNFSSCDVAQCVVAILISSSS